MFFYGITMGKIKFNILIALTAIMVFGCESNNKQPTFTQEEIQKYYHQLTPQEQSKFNQMNAQEQRRAIRTYRGGEHKTQLKSKKDEFPSGKEILEEIIHATKQATKKGEEVIREFIDSLQK